MQPNRSRLLPPIGCSNTHNRLGGLHWWGPSLSWNQNLLCGPPEGGGETGGRAAPTTTTKPGRRKCETEDDMANLCHDQELSLLCHRTTLEVIQAHILDPPRPTPPAGEGFSGKVET
ncbi:unnamed protein product [Boreogadus saida]